MRKLVVLGLVGLTGCAGLVGEPTQTITVVTEPPGADCVLERNDKPIGEVAETPGDVLIGKGRKIITVNCTLPGFQPGTAQLLPMTEDFRIGNVEVGGITRTIINDLHGDALNTYPSMVRITLRDAADLAQAIGKGDRPTEAIAALR